MKHKILVLTNKLDISIKDDCEQARIFFEERPNPIFVEFSFMPTDLPVGMKSYMEAKGFDPATGKPTTVEYWGLDSATKNLCRNYTTPGEYQTVIFIYNRIELEKPTYLPTNFTNYNPLFKGTEFIQMPANKYLDDNKKLIDIISHEIMHAFCFRINRDGAKVVDEMDKTIVGGQIIPFYKQDNPNALDGNYAHTLRNLKPYLELLYSEKKETYEFFSEYEVKRWKLKPELFIKLDIARREAGIPFIITSGLRTLEHNKLVGGASNSTHLTGLGCDLRAETDEQRYSILRGLYKANFARIGIYKNHIHVDISVENYKQNIVWLSDKD